MRMRFIGGVGGSITGSCTHFRYDRTNTDFLVDCGLSQGEAHSDYENQRPFPFESSDMKFVILTHAHTDHCGLLIKLYKDGFRGKIYCTTATCKLTKRMLLDALKRQKTIYDFDKDEHVVDNLRFECVDQRSDFGLSRSIPIDNDIFIFFLRSAHILGSVSVGISWKISDEEFKSIVLSGDLGNNTKDNPYQSLLSFRQSPFYVPDYMVVESTYGDRPRAEANKKQENRIQALAKIVKKATITNKRPLVIPAFSLQRSQDVLFDLYFYFHKNATFWVSRNLIWKTIPSPLFLTVRLRITFQRFFEMSCNVDR